jgi:hypothetical protein
MQGSRFVYAESDLSFAWDERRSSPHPQFVGGFERRSAFTADHGAAIAAGKRIGNFRRTFRTIERFW